MDVFKILRENEIELVVIGMLLIAVGILWRRLIVKDEHIRDLNEQRLEDVKIHGTQMAEALRTVDRLAALGEAWRRNA